MSHEPDPQFIEHLKWQVRTAVQRRERFATPVAGPGLRWARTALLVCVSLLGGAGAVIAAEHYQDEQQKEFLVARARIELEMAVIELEFAKKAQGRIEALVQVGVISTAERIEANMHVNTTSDLVRERRLDLEEIELTGEEPRRDLGAPVIGKRDFVTEHLSLEIARAKNLLEPLRDRAAIVKQQYEAGITNVSELHELDHELVIAEAALTWARRRLALRTAFIAGEHTLEELQLLELEGEHELAVNELTRRLEVVRRQLDLERVRVAEGSARSNGRVELEVQLLEKTLELRKLELNRVRERL